MLEWIMTLGMLRQNKSILHVVRYEFGSGQGQRADYYVLGCVPIKKVCEILINPSSSECGLIWKRGHCRGDQLR